LTRPSTSTVHDVVERVNLEETLVIVTADHATGGLEITANNGRGYLPTVTWSTRGHNEGAVDIFAMGKGQEAFSQRLDVEGGIIDNTEIFDIMTRP
jgi:alkaline phosphatase